MCTCYRNWQSADCSERSCPYGWSFTTTPQGDLNMDGDRFDSTMRPIVFKSDTPKYFCISAVSSSAPTTTFTLDADNDEANDITDAVVYRYLQDMPNPSGTWESWPGYATTKWQDDGHFYMECSNAGACDRSDGSCLCFSGYTGLACSRTTCPLDCSGHGTCMSVRDLAVKAPNKLSVTGSATMGSTW